MREDLVLFEGVVMETGDKGGKIHPVTTSFSEPLGDLLYAQTLHNSDLCDVSLVYGGTEQRVHKCVLLTSEYFHALYESGLLENKDKININVGRPSAIHEAIKFLYVRKVEITMENVVNLMEVADYLQISEMKKECIKFLTNVPLTAKSSIVNCLIGCHYGLDEVYARGYDYLIAHLPDVLKEDEILTLDKDCILDILKSKTLIYVPADDLFLFLIQWVEFDLDNRLPHLPELFCSFDLQRFSEESYKNLVSCHTLINMFPTCRDHLSKFATNLEKGYAKLNSKMKYVYLVAGAEAQSRFELKQGRYPFHINMRQLLGFLPWEERWVEFPPMPIRFTSHTLLAGSLAAIYATESKTLLPQENKQQMYKYDVFNKKWVFLHALIPYYEKNKSFCVHHLQYIGGSLHVLASTKSNDLTMSINLYELVENQTSELIWKKEISTTGVNPQGTKVSSLLVDDRYLCVSVQSRTVYEATEELLVSVFDSELDLVTDCSEGSLLLTMMFSKDNRVVFAEPGIGYAKVLSLDSYRWTVEPELGIPAIPNSEQPTEYNSFYYSNKIFIMGGREKEKQKYVLSTYVFDFSTKTWEEVKSCPSIKVINTTSSLIQMSSENLQCDVNCPHCLYTGTKNQAEYDLGPLTDAWSVSRLM